MKRKLYYSQKLDDDNAENLEGNPKKHRSINNTNDETQIDCTLENASEINEDAKRTASESNRSTNSVKSIDSSQKQVEQVLC